MVASIEHLHPDAVDRENAQWCHASGMYLLIYRRNMAYIT
jgi:hypothetical protein